MDTGNIPGKKPGTRRLSRSEIVDGLKRTPVASVLLGAQSKTRKLTAKQAAFAERIALGDTKAGAYRAAYNTNTNPVAQSIEGQRLVKNPIVALQIDAIRLAIEAANHATPAALRSLVIQKLTELAINPSEKAAQRLRALELLGKVTEVAAFTERRELIHTESAVDSRSKLIANLRLALANNLPSHLIDAAGRNIVTDCETMPVDGEHVPAINVSGEGDGERGSVDGEPSDAPAQDSQSLDCGQSDPTPPHPPDEIFDLARSLA
jgi:hypothetical protein